MTRFIGLGERADITVVVVTYNSAGDIDRLVDSLRGETADVSIRLVVADNDSRDETLGALSAHDDVILISTGGNLGFAGGINTTRDAIGPCAEVLFLNPDARVSRGSLALLAARRRERGAGAIAPRIVDDAGDTFRSLRREPSLLRAVGDAALGRFWANRPAWLSEVVRCDADYARPHRIDWASGAALMVAAEVAREVGAWDERFFLYSEETDYQRRVRDAGYEIWYEPDAVVHHSERGSGFSSLLDQLIAVNRVRYARLHLSPLTAAAYRGAVALHHLLRSSSADYRVNLRTVIDESKWATLPHASQRASPALVQPPPHMSAAPQSIPRSGRAS